MSAMSVEKKQVCEKSKNTIQKCFVVLNQLGMLKQVLKISVSLTHASAKINRLAIGTLETSDSRFRLTIVVVQDRRRIIKQVLPYWLLTLNSGKKIGLAVLRKS